MVCQSLSFIAAYLLFRERSGLVKNPRVAKTISMVRTMVLFVVRLYRHPRSAISTAIQSVLLHPRKTRGGVISLLERDGSLPRTLSPRRLPWVAASAIPVAVSGIALLLARNVLLPFSSPASISWLAVLFGDVSYAIGLGVPVLVGYLFILRFEYSSKGIFITSAASTYVMVTAEFLALVGSSPGHTVFDLLWTFVASAFSALLGAILTVAGSGLGRIALAKRQAPPG